jgi:sugar phosphate isomerase/epimerase
MSRQSRPYSRRQFGQIALAGGAAALAWPGATLFADSKVRIGVQSYSLRTLAWEDALKAMKTIGLPECELWSGHLEPRPTMVPNPNGGPPRPPEGWRDEVRAWRMTAPSVRFMDVRREFQAAGVALQAYNISFNDSFTDLEIEKGFEQAQALGVKLITASSNLKTVPRLVPYADKFKITVAFHNHSNVKDPNEFATPESFEKAIAQSKRFGINLDIGHFVAANFDPIAFITTHHKRITNLHLKDRKKDQGANVPWGEGDTPIKEVLQLLKKNKYDIPANVEYEYRGEDAVAEVKKCYEFVKAALA